MSWALAAAAALQAWSQYEQQKQAEEQAEANRVWANTEAGSREKWAYEAEQKALEREQSLAIAQADAGARLAAAQASAGAQIQSSKIGAASNFYDTRSKVLTENLAQRWAAQKALQEARALGVTKLPEYAQAVGRAGQAGYGQAADILSRFRA